MSPLHYLGKPKRVITTPGLIKNLGTRNNLLESMNERSLENTRQMAVNILDVSKLSGSDKERLKLWKK